VHVIIAYNGQSTPRESPHKCLSVSCDHRMGPLLRGGTLPVIRENHDEEFNDVLNLHGLLLQLSETITGTRRQSEMLKMMAGASNDNHYN